MSCNKQYDKSKPVYNNFGRLAKQILDDFTSDDSVVEDDSEFIEKRYLSYEYELSDYFER